MANVATAFNLNEFVNLDDLCVNTIRTLAIDAIQQANSGHPGTPMGMAPTRCTRFGSECSGSIPKTRSGRIAIASCSPQDMRPCSCTRSST